jgi:hypothetical protein
MISAKVPFILIYALPKFSLLALTPCTFIVKVDVSALFVVFGDYFGFFMSLEPRQVLFVESPGLLFQFLCR